MRKPDSLRAALTAALPDLVRNPDRLAIFIDRGSIAARMSAAPNHPNPSFEYRYRLTALLTDLPADRPDIVMVAAVDWLHIHQPDLLQSHAGDPIDFEAEILDGETIDLVMRLQLSESVVARARDGGGFDLTRPADPPAIEEFDGVPRWTPLERIYVDGTLMLGEDP